MNKINVRANNRVRREEIRMESESVLRYLNNPNNWYVSKAKCLLPIRPTAISTCDYEIYHVNKIEESTQIEFESMRNVLDAMRIPGIVLFYIVEGDEGTLKYYYGVSVDPTYPTENSTGKATVREAMEILKAVFMANYPLNSLERLKEHEKHTLQKKISSYAYGGMIEGVPGLFNDNTKTLGASKVKQAMLNDDFLFIEILKPMSLVENNCLTNSLLQVATCIEAEANRTESCVVSGSCSVNCNTSFGKMFSNSNIRSNNETRKEFRIEDTGDEAEVVPGVNTEVEERQQLPTQSPSTSRVADVINGVLDKGILGEDNSFTDLQQSLEISELQAAQLQNGTTNAVVPVRATPSSQLVNRQLGSTLPVPRGRALPARGQQAFANVLAAPTIPVGAALASQFTGGSLPLIDGEFFISDIERQVSIGQNNTKLTTNSNNVSRARNDTQSHSTTRFKRIQNRTAVTWLQYIDQVLYPRLDLGKIEGLYLFGTGIFANRRSTLVKLASVLKYTYNSNGFNNIPMMATEFDGYDGNWESFTQFQIPRYGCRGGQCCFSQEEIKMRTIFSQEVFPYYGYAGSYVSSRELSSIVALPL